MLWRDLVITGKLDQFLTNRGQKWYQSVQNFTGCPEQKKFEWRDNRPVWRGDTRPVMT